MGACWPHWGQTGAMATMCCPEHAAGTPGVKAPLRRGGDGRGSRPRARSCRMRGLLVGCGAVCALVTACSGTSSSHGFPSTDGGSSSSGGGSSGGSGSGGSSGGLIGGDGGGSSSGGSGCTGAATDYV